MLRFIQLPIQTIRNAFYVVNKLTSWEQDLRFLASLFRLYHIISETQKINRFITY